MQTQPPPCPFVNCEHPDGIDGESSVCTTARANIAAKASNRTATSRHTQRIYIAADKACTTGTAADTSNFV